MKNGDTRITTKVIQISNIAPQATKDQLSTLFGYLGRIEDIRLYPTIRDVSMPVQSRICFIKFGDRENVGVSQHITNTVFIDRALVIIPYLSGEMPDEKTAMEIINSYNNMPGLPPNARWPEHITNVIDGILLRTIDPRLTKNNLPEYPNLPATTDHLRVNDIRRTIVLDNLDSTATPEDVLDFIEKAGNVKYLKMGVEQDGINNCLVEFAELVSLVPALKLHGHFLKGKPVRVSHSTAAIIKPQTKTNETSQREIEETLQKLKQAHNTLYNPNVDPLAFLDSLSKESMLGDRSRSRSRSRKHRSKSKEKARSRKSRSKSRPSSKSKRSSKSRRRSRSRSKSRSKSKSKRRSRSRSRKKSRSISRTKKSRSSRSRSRRRSRSKSRSRRHKSKDRKSSRRDKDKEKDRERDRERKDKSDKVKEVLLDSSPEKVIDSKHDEIEASKSNGHDSSSPSKADDDRKEKHSSRSKKSRSKSRSRSRDRKRKRSKTRSKSRDRKSRRRRSRSPSSRRSRSRSRSRSRRRDRRRSPTPDRRRRRSSSPSRSSRKSSHRDRSRSKDRRERKEKDKSRKDKRRDKEEKKKETTVSRNYDEEDEMFSESRKTSDKGGDEETAVDMDISD